MNAEQIAAKTAQWQTLLALVKAANAAAEWITEARALAKAEGTLSSLPGTDCSPGQRGRKEVRALRQAIRQAAALLEREQ